ncbi:hypothetical protein K438DRAFT_1996895 [Mycena galopus ATCC 62051]|nr:hypothetical protein K438DRAFT_1996895 [Mycena galopus ATCC 62051]
MDPLKLDLWPDCDNVEIQLREFPSTDCMRDNDAPFLASSVSPGFPTTRLTICDEAFAVPVSPRDMAFLATHLGNDNKSGHCARITRI